MKFIPLITLLLWGLIVALYFYLQEIFLQPAIKFPLLIILTIFITVSFWSLQKQGKKLFALLFIAIFVCNTGILAYGLVFNHNLLSSLNATTAAPLDPEMARLLITGDSEIERQTAARIIFERHGIALSYKTTESNFKLYVPTKSDRDAFIHNQDLYVQKTQLKNNLTYQTIPLFFLLLLQIVIFSGLLIYLIFSDTQVSRQPKQ